MEKLIEEFSIGLFFWQTVIFVILIFLLKKVAWRPILKAVNDREQGIKDALQSAELAKKEMESLKADNDKIMKEARGIKNSIVSQAKDEAKAEAQKIIENANESIKNEKNAAVSEIKKQVATLSIDIAEKILKEKLSDDDKQMQIVEELLKDVKLK